MYVGYIDNERIISLKSVFSTKFKFILNLGVFIYRYEVEESPAQINCILHFMKYGIIN